LASSDSIRDLMTRNPRTIERSTSLAEAARLMRDEDTGVLPIVDGDRLVGVLTDRDIAIRAVGEGRDPSSTSAGDIASTTLVTIDPQQSIDEAMRLMSEHQVRRLPVTEEDGRLVGIVSQADFARHASDERIGETVSNISQ
jgi:CBS domain-containing protein